MIEKPGIYAVPADEYHADPCAEPSLSRSVAKLLVDRSPMHARWRHPRLNAQLGPRKGANNLDIGSGCHMLLLGKGAQIDVCEERDWKRKSAQEFRASAWENGRIPVTRPQMDKMLRMEKAAREQMGDVEITEPETTWIANDLGVWLRCMTDGMSPDGMTIYDYKTTAGSAHPTQGIPRIASQQGYDFQQAFYERVITSVQPEVAGRLRFEFLVQEVEEPFALCMAPLSEADVAVARRQVDYAVGLWKACLERGEWPGYGRAVDPVKLPEWRFREWLQREMEEMERGAHV